MALIGGALVLLATSVLGSANARESSPQDRVAMVRRVAATAQLAAQEYRVGVSNGRITAKAEVDEARLFLQESRRSAALLPLEARQETLSRLDSLVRLVDGVVSPDSLDTGVRQLTETL